MAKEFTFRGKSLGELKEMPVEQFAELCKSRVKRAIVKGAKSEKFRKLLKKVELAAKGMPKKAVKTHMREFPIIPAMVGQKIGIYKGNEFVMVDIVPEMLGHRLGEFALTRKRLTHGKAGIGATRSSTAIATRK